MKNKRFRLFPATIASGFILLSPAAFADAITWVAGGANNNWSTLLNWSDNASPAGDDVTFDATGATASGVTNTVTTSESINSLSYSFEDAANQHTTDIAAGQILAVAGDFLLAGSDSAVDPTNVTITGSTGALTVDGTSFQIGQLTPASGTANNSLDMSGLGTLDANLDPSTGIFRLGPNSGGTTGPLVTAKLPATSTITANLLGVGDRSGRGGTHLLKLGSVENTINANTITVGTNSGRGNGELSFETGAGTLLLRAADGTSAATMNLINNGFGTGNNVTGIANFAGHSVDAKIGLLTMGRRIGGATSNATSTFTFDIGTLEVATLKLAENGSLSSTAGTINATMNIGGGTASFGAITMATNNGAVATTANAVINLTGGDTLVTGDIVKIGGTGTTSAKVILDGGMLDMDNGNIGDATNAVVLTLASGTLENVAEINGGADLSKTSAGNLVLSGNNTFTGGMNMFGGEVLITDSGSFGSGVKNLNVQNGAYINLDGTAGDISLASDISMTTAGFSFLNTVGDNTINGNITLIAGNGSTTATSDDGSLNLAGTIESGTNSLRILELSGSSAGANQVSGIIADGAGSSLLRLDKTGTGTWALTNDGNTFTQNVNVNEGELKITKSGALGLGTKTINLPASPNVGYLSLDGSAGAITVSSDMTMKTAGNSLLNIAGDNVINSPIFIVGGSVETIVTSDSGSLDLAGAISAEITSEYRRLVLTGTSTGANTISGLIADGNSRIDLLKTGAGNWALTNASNTYTGNTSVQEGILTVTTPNFDDASTVSIGSSENPGVGFLNLPNAGDDLVATLVIDGVEQDAGKTYGNASSSLPIIATSAITGPGTITVPGSGTPYSIWADTFAPGNDVSDPAGDNDNDGLTNQQEFAFGLSPIDGSSVNPILAQVNKTAGTFTYQRRAGTGLTYRILTSETLQAGSWTEDLTAGQVATPSGDNETVVVTLTGAPLTAAKLFVRVAAD